MRPVCIIPARSGSKGLPNKNMLYLAFKPLIFHTIDAAIESGCFLKEDIYVSTDSLLYKEICEERGINVVLRSKKLSDDYATSFDVNKDFLKKFDEKQVFVLLQATSPFRNKDDIKNALNLFYSSDCENVVSFVESSKALKLFTELDENGYIKDNIGSDNQYRRQNNKVVYYPNGSIYISRKDYYLKNGCYMTDKTKAYLMDKKTALDIDDIYDFNSCLGNIFFDYKRREEINKGIFNKRYSSLKKVGNIILSDSRFMNITIDGFNNCSVDGVSLKILNDNLYLFDTKKIDKVFISLGVNDFMIGHSQNEIQKYMINILEYFKNNKIYLSSVIYTLFRLRDNNEIIKFNEWLSSYAMNNSISYIDLNDYLSKDNNLRYKYSLDGLNFNDDANCVIYKMIERFINCDE